MDASGMLNGFLNKDSTYKVGRGDLLTEASQRQTSGNKENAGCELCSPKIK